MGPTKVSDPDLIDGFLKGDKEPTETVVHWIRAVVFHSAWQDFENAEDVVSDAVFKTYRTLRSESFRHESSLRVFVSRIARYTVVDAIRREKTIRELLKEENLTLPECDDPSQVVEEQEERSLFGRIWDLIDPKCRRLWLMIFNDHLLYKTIAANEGVAESTVKNRVLRCKEEAMRVKERILERPSRV